jgi:signal transduction histidine kinase
MESINWVDDRAKLKGLKLEIDMDKGITALGNYEYIKIVLRNLLSNAVKYCRHQDQIVVFADPIPGQLLIKLGVKDTGLGISPPSLEKLKNNIFNSSTLGTNQEEGNGLGLLLCQTYLHKINSSLVIESEWKKGSEFSFTLPIAEIPNT